MGNPTARTRTIPAPVGGWNARDAVADMAETDAVVLQNWFPTEGKCVARPGFALSSSGGSMTTAVETLAEFDTSISAIKRIAASDGRLWDVTTATATSLGSGFTNNRWQTVMMDGKLGLVNGQDAPQTFDGTTLTAMTISGTALTVSTLIGVHTFKARSYFWAAGSQDFWYSAINTLGGALTKFPLSRIGTMGGEITLINTWSRDGGNGPADYFVVVMSTGTVIIYGGSDPGADFSLVGVYKIAKPLGRRCSMKYGADLVISTIDGYASLSQVIMDNPPAVSDKIRKAVSDAAVANSAGFGWEITHFSGQNVAVFNVPRSTVNFDQHVINLATKAWCKFTGWDASCFLVSEGSLYFGGLGAVYKAWSGTDDNGASIVLDAVTAFNFFKTQSNKSISAVQTFLASTGALNLGLSIESDFVVGSRPPVNLSVSVVGTPWNSPWNSPWGTPLAQFKPWKGITKNGRALSTRLVCDIKNFNLEWYACTIAYQVGGLI